MLQIKANFSVNTYIKFEFLAKFLNNFMIKEQTKT